MLSTWGHVLDGSRLWRRRRSRVSKVTSRIQLHAGIIVCAKFVHIQACAVYVVCGSFGGLDTVVAAFV